MNKCAGKATVLPARLPSQPGSGDGLALAGSGAVSAADCPADERLHTCGHVFLLLSGVTARSAALEAACDHRPDRAVCLQVGWPHKSCFMA